MNNKPPSILNTLHGHHYLLIDSYWGLCVQTPIEGSLDEINKMLRYEHALLCFFASLSAALHTGAPFSENKNNLLNMRYALHAFAK